MAEDHSEAYAEDTVEEAPRVVVQEAGASVAAVEEAVSQAADTVEALAEHADDEAYKILDDLTESLRRIERQLASLPDDLKATIAVSQSATAHVAEAAPPVVEPEAAPPEASTREKPRRRGSALGVRRKR